MAAMPAPYKKRVIDEELRLRLASAGAVVIEGPKACGKTATAETFAASVVFLDVDEQARRAADVEPGQCILTGSAGPADDTVRGSHRHEQVWRASHAGSDHRERLRARPPDGVAVIPIGSLGP
jgi:hypothetical protein